MSERALGVAILTVSDSSAQGLRADRSGPALVSQCSELGWQVVATAVVPDDADAITRQLRDWIEGERQDHTISLVLTTGGTGVTARDVTPEATRPVLEKELPGLAELMRQKGLDQTPFSVLSRALAGTNAQTLIVNLPGSPAGAVFSLTVIAHLIPHIVRLLAGQTEHPEGDTGNSDS